MKLFSTNRNSEGRQLVCDDAVFDPNLIITLRADAEEKVITFRYDFAECGHPLNLPFDVQTINFLVKLTKHDIHICAIAEPCEDLAEQYEEFIGDMGEIEFDVRMNVEEKYILLLSLFLPLLSKIKAQEKTPDKAKSSTAAKEYAFNESTFKEAMENLFPNLFGNNNLKDKQ